VLNGSSFRHRINFPFARYGELLVRFDEYSAWTKNDDVASARLAATARRAPASLMQRAIAVRVLGDVDGPLLMHLVAVGSPSQHIAEEPGICPAVWQRDRN
jgi:hypothetical protein